MRNAFNNVVMASRDSRHRGLWVVCARAAATVLLIATPACEAAEEEERHADFDQPGEGAWAACDVDVACDGGLYCSTDREPGFCTVGCPKRDPQFCLPAPEGLGSEVGCVPSPLDGPTGGRLYFCALLCSDEAPCPRGMNCVPDTFGEMRYCE